MRDFQLFSDQMKLRRSTRAFAPVPVDDELIKSALEIANNAPSGANLQPWFFSVISDPEVKKELRTQAELIEVDFYLRRAPLEWKEKLEVLKTNHKKEFLTQASHLIVVFSRNFVETAKGREKAYFPLESTGLASGFLLCALAQAGLHTLTYTPKPASFLNQICQRERTDHPFLIIVVGHACRDYLPPLIEKKSLEQVAEFR
jgi:iodotyrosine deiodinase